MKTLVVAKGTVVHDQLAGRFQSELDEPSHIPVIQVFTFNIPVFPESQLVSAVFGAPEAVAPQVPAT